MRRPLVDLNIVLDALLDRPPQGEAAARLWAAAERKSLDALVPAHCVTTLFYLVRQAKGPAARSGPSRPCSRRSAWLLRTKPS